VDPSTTKGLISVAPSDDGLLHFYWANRENNNIEEDLILFPGDASFVPVQQVQGGRTYVLKFASSDQRFFFWMQDADPSRDEELVTKINNALNESFEDDEPMAATSMEEDHPAEPTPQPSAGALSGATPEELARLQALISSLGGVTGNRTGVHRMMQPEVALSDILTPTNLKPLFENEALLRSVYPLLPDDLPMPPSIETVRRIVESPPFQAGVRQFDQALSTGLLQGLVVGLGLPQDAGLGVGPFLEAIKEQAKKDSGEEKMD